MLSEQTRAAVLAAADFFAANPDKRTTAVLARDDMGFPVEPTNPRACKWCGLGRIAKELEITEIDGDYGQLVALGLETDRIWDTNDGRFKNNTPAFVDFLRKEIANA